MSGLDRMKAQILEEADCTAQEILEQANEQAEAIIKTAREEAELQAGAIAQKAERDAQEYEKRAASSADMRRKQAVLSAKQEVIREVLEKAYEHVMNLDDEKYFELLEKLLGKYVLLQDGVIYFSKQDLERMPEGFSGKIKTIAAEKGGSLTLSGEGRQTEGGFLLAYGGIEENCTIRAVFDSKREELSDKVNRLLFG